MVILILHSSQGKLTTLQAVLSVVFFLPGFISPFLPRALSRFVLAIDIVFSYLYVESPLTSKAPALPLHILTFQFQVVDLFHLLCARLQYQSLLLQLPSRRWLQAQEGQRGLHLPRFVS